MSTKFPINFYDDGKQYLVEIKPLSRRMEKLPTRFEVFMNNMYYGLVQRSGDNWETNSPKCEIVLGKIGHQISNWYDENY
jgi:hypothetical protein